MRKILCAMLFLAVASPAWAEDTVPAKADTSEIIYRVNLGRADDVKMLINQGADANMKNADGVPLIALAAARPDEEAPNVIQALLDSGAKIDAKDNNGQTALFYAAKKGNLKTVQFLLEHNASYYVIDDNGDIARTIAYNEGHKNVLDAMDNFVRNQTDKVKKQYEEYNRTMGERFKKDEEAQKTPEPPKLPAPEITEDPLPEIQTPPKPEKPVPPPAEKPDPEALKQTTYDLAFHNCAFQYWSFCQSSKQSTELSEDELSVAVDSHKDKVLQLIRDMMEKYHSTRKYTDYVSSQAKRHIFNRLAIMPSNTYRHEQGIGKMDDMSKRCEDIAKHWDDPVPPLPVAKSNKNYRSPMNPYSNRRNTRH